MGRINKPKSNAENYASEYGLRPSKSFNSVEPIS